MKFTIVFEGTPEDLRLALLEFNKLPKDSDLFHDLEKCDQCKQYRCKVQGDNIKIEEK